MYGLRWLGLIDSNQARNTFLGFWFWRRCDIRDPFLYLAGDLSFFGVALPIGMIIGLMAFVALKALRGWEAEKKPGNLLVAGLLASIIAHFIEIHFGSPSPQRVRSASRCSRCSSSSAVPTILELDLFRGSSSDAPSDVTATAPTRRRKRKRRASVRPEQQGGLSHSFFEWLSSSLLLCAS